jgi:hypothetical protein
MNTDNCLTYLIDAFSQGEKETLKRNLKREKELDIGRRKSTVTKLRIQKLRNYKEEINRNETKEKGNTEKKDQSKKRVKKDI